MFNPFKILCFTCEHCSDIHDNERTDGISSDTRFYCTAYHKELFTFKMRCRYYDELSKENHTNAEKLARDLLTMEETEYQHLTDMLDCSGMHLAPETDCWHSDCTECKVQWLSRPVKNKSK